jgi:hypothetical protein
MMLLGSILVGFLPGVAKITTNFFDKVGFDLDVIGL